MFKKSLFLAACLMISFIVRADQIPKPITLKAIEETLVVDGKAKKVFNLVQPDGTEGFVGTKGQYFDVTLKNETHVPISIHWHGLILPNDQDGIPYVTQLPIKPGSSQHYHFKLLQAGTFWMHSHFMFHEQELMTAPFIIQDPNEPYADDKNIVVMLQGFTFKDPKQIFADLKHSPMANMNMSNMDMSNMNMTMSMPMHKDLNDVVYDAYLANRRTLQNPEIFKVKPGEKVRLRLINGSSANNFWINTGKLPATLIAVDGNLISPIHNTDFQLAVAQRIDLEITIPASGGVFPILAKVEGLKQQTGFILATANAAIPHISEMANTSAPALNNDQDILIHSLNPLQKKPITTSLKYQLTGDMMHYIWKINDEVWPNVTPYTIKKGDRVEMVFVNDTGMAHPMHFHGHVFQVTEINGRSLNNGPLRDTILVLPHTTEKIVFDANNPGIWMMHCHVLYHMMAGMMTTTNYLDYPAPSYYQDLINGKMN